MTTYYIDENTLELKEGYPPLKIKVYGKAPIYLSDEMRPTRHPATGQVIESRKKWAETDKITGCLTLGKREPPKDRREERRQALAKDRREAMLKSVAQIDAGNAPLNEEQRALCKIQNDIVSDALNFNAHDVVGRKNSESGKRYRKRYKR